MQSKPKPGLRPGDVAHPIELLDLSTRPYNALRRSGVRSIEPLLLMSHEEILSIRGIGSTCYDEICQALQRWRQSPPTQGPTPSMLEPELDEKHEGQSLCQAWSLPTTLQSDQTTITTLALRPHAEHELMATGISAVGQLAALSVSELRGFRWFGISTIDDIRRKLSNHALLHATPHAPPSHHSSERSSPSDKPQLVSPAKLSSQELVDGWIRRLRSIQRQAIIDGQPILADEPEAPCDADAIDGLTATSEADRGRAAP